MDVPSAAVRRRMRISNCATAFSGFPDVHGQFVDAAWSMMVTVDDCAEVVLSGVPRKSEPHRLLLSPPQARWRPPIARAELASPTAASKVRGL